MRCVLPDAAFNYDDKQFLSSRSGAGAFMKAVFSHQIKVVMEKHRHAGRFGLGVNRPMGQFSSRCVIRREKNLDASALVITLFAIVIVTVVILAFFLQASLNRRISFSSAGQARANILALSALNFIKGDFVAEIESGSAQPVIDPSGLPVFEPLSNTNMVPYRMTNAAANAAIPSNLIKCSSGAYPLWPPTGYGTYPQG